MKNIICFLLAMSASAAVAEPPEGYVPIDYIPGSNIRPFINTGFVPNPQTDQVEARISFSSVAGGQTIWCARTTGSKGSWSVFMQDSGLLRVDYHDSYGPKTLGQGTPLEKDVIYTFTMSNTAFRASNGASFDYSNIVNFTNTVNPLVLFCAYSTNAVDQNCWGSHSTSMRLHGLKIWRSGELLHDYVPYRKADVFQPVLWDRIEDAVLETSGCWVGPDRATNLAVRVGDQFFAGDHAVTPDLAVTDATTGRVLMPGEDYEVNWSDNDAPGTAKARLQVRYGSGTFGETVVPVKIRRAVPAGYTPLEFIQGDGHTWLLTDYMPNPQTDKLKLDYELTRVETTAFTCARDNGGNSTWSVCIINNQYRLDYQWAGTQQAHTGQVVAGAPYSFTLENEKLTLNDGNQIVNVANPSFTSTVNPLQFYAFYLNGPNSGSRNTVSYYRTYRCQVWRSGALIHDWAPVRSPQGVVTLVDTVTGLEPELRTDGVAGAGFIAGPAIARSFTTAAVPLQTWDGSTPCTPTPDVRDAASGAPLVVGTDYTVAYAGNDAPGTAYATITGLAAYAGATSVVPFAVARAIPSEYEPLEYIQGANRAYFLTDYTPNPSEDRIEMNLELTQTGIDAAPFCARNGGNGDTYTVFLLKSGALRADYFNTVRFQTTTDLNLQTGRRYLLRYAGPHIDFGGEVGGGYFPKYGFTQAGSALHLFVDTTLTYHSTHRLFDCAVWRAGVPLRLWTPVKRTTDGVATLYDRITGTALAPHGGVFIAGPKKADYDIFVHNQPWTEGERFRPKVAATNTLTGAELVSGGDYTRSFTTNVAARYGVATAMGRTGTAYEGQARSCDFELYPALPEGYERLEYIQGDGQTALLTDITPTPAKDRVQASFMATERETQGVFCSRGESGSDRSWSFCVIKSDLFRNRFDFGTSNMTYGTVLCPYDRIRLSVRNNKVDSGSGDSFTVAGAGLAQAGGPLALLGFYAMQNENPVFSSYSTIRLYSFRYWHDGALTLDLVPVRTPEGVVTLFDYVAGEPLTPTGKAGGAFIAGPVWDVDPPPLPGLFILIR